MITKIVLFLLYAFKINRHIESKSINKQIIFLKTYDVCLSISIYMYHSIKIAQSLTVGSYKSKSKDHKENIIDMTKVFDQNRCVIHLIDTERYKFEQIKQSEDEAEDDGEDEAEDDGEDEDGDEDENNNNNHDHVINVISGELITKFINDQHIKLWNMMKRGDLIEDLAVTRYQSVKDCMSLSSGRYIVDHILKSNSERKSSINIMQNELCVRDLCCTYDPNGTIYPDMMSRTEFSINYFDDSKLIVNDVLCPGQTFRSRWNNMKMMNKLIYINTKELQNLELKDIQWNKLLINNNSEHYYVHYLYIIDRSVEPNILYLSRYSEQYFEYDITKMFNMFMKQFKNNNVFELCDTPDNYHERQFLASVALVENTSYNNVMII